MKSKARRQAAFSLIEMIVVLAIISIISVSAALSLRQPLQQARIQRALGSLETADRRARQAAIQSSTNVTLTFDTDKGTVSVTGQGLDTDRRPLELDGGIRIDRFETRQRPADGKFATSISPFGQSETYAIRLRTGEDSREWLVIIGATGQAIRSKEDNIVETIFSAQN